MFDTGKRVRELTDEVERLKYRLGTLDDVVDRLLRLHVDPLTKVPGIEPRWCRLSHEMPNGFSVTDNFRAWEEYMGVGTVTTPSSPAKLKIEPRKVCH